MACSNQLPPLSALTLLHSIFLFTMMTGDAVQEAKATLSESSKLLILTGGKQMPAADEPLAGKLGEQTQAPVSQTLSPNCSSGLPH